jgi:hypothetical protein
MKCKRYVFREGYRGFEEVMGGEVGEVAWTIGVEIGREQKKKAQI